MVFWTPPKLPSSGFNANEQRSLIGDERPGWVLLAPWNVFWPCTPFKPWVAVPRIEVIDEVEDEDDLSAETNDSESEISEPGQDSSSAKDDDYVELYCLQNGAWQRAPIVDPHSTPAQLPFNADLQPPDYDLDKLDDEVLFRSRRGSFVFGGADSGGVGTHPTRGIRFTLRSILWQAHHEAGVPISEWILLRIDSFNMNDYIGTCLFNANAGWQNGRLDTFAYIWGGATQSEHDELAAARTRLLEYPGTFEMSFLACFLRRGREDCERSIQYLLQKFVPLRQLFQAAGEGFVDVEKEAASDHSMIDHSEKACE
ncbi:MAG: hypothetical protein M1828_000338 [Chrysothrix sp. TS-e1954]|nr:MAG: hypothetical protein M1828_000338 [Chrysothrix sp. TS-e1954]